MRIGLLALILALAFIIGEAMVLGTLFYLVHQNWRLRRHLNLGTLILGLLSVPAAITMMTFLIRGP